MSDLKGSPLEDWPRVAKLFVMAQEIAWQTPGFFEKKGPGHGDRASAQFMSTLRRAAQSKYGCDLSEKRACQSAKWRFDFYFPEEKTAVEFAFGLCNPLSEYERDIFKCLLAQKEGLPIEKLFLIGKPGANARQEAPGPRAIADFVELSYGLKVDVIELLEQKPKASPKK
jgi:hypothetical protein